MIIKLIASEVDNTLWHGTLDERDFGRGFNAAHKLESNLELDRLDKLVIRDRSDHSNYVKLFSDVPKVIHDIVARGIKVAIVSQNTSKSLCDRALWLYKADDEQNEPKPIISLIQYDEVGIDRICAFSQIQAWSQLAYDEMVFFDSSPSGAEVQKLGVRFEHVINGVTWDAYQQILKRDTSARGSSEYDTPFYDQPALGVFLGQGKFAMAYTAKDNSHTVVKVMKIWTRELRRHFLEIYGVIKDGHPFEPSTNNDDQYLLMIALELRNLDMVQQLKDPKPENFSGWFSMAKIEGTPLWKTPLYRKHPFSVTFQRLVKTAFHLAVDEIEYHVKNYGVEHRDAHLANVYFTMQDNQPVKAHLLDWGIAVQMTFDGVQYIRGDDVLVWQNSEAGQKYTPEEFRRYWITWMVNTEYEANITRHTVTERDGREFLKDLAWWFVRND